MRNTIFGLLATDFTDWQELEVGVVMEVVDNLNHLTLLSKKLLGDALIDAESVAITLSLQAPLDKFAVFTVCYQEYETDYEFHLNQLLGA